MNSESITLFNSLKNLDTEQRNPETMHIDLADSDEIARLINQEDRKVPGNVAERLSAIAEAIELVSNALSVGGRLLYFGAGTSGRLGVLDAAECPPTFGSDPEEVKGLIAGGEKAMFVAQEGAEDDPKFGVEDVKKENIGKLDVVCALAASGRTPYVHGALAEASRRGAKTIMICCVPANQVDLDIEVDVMIDMPVGPEVIMGSTRMKSGTAQKLACNMLTTGAMIRRGKIYENVMVDLQLTNKKLVERARRIIMMFSEVDYQEASRLLEETGGKVKTALLMALSGMSKSEAENMLDQHNGFIRAALQSYSK